MGLVGLKKEIHHIGGYLVTDPWVNLSTTYLSAEP